MDISDLKERQERAEYAVLDILTAFERDTGVEVTSIDLQSYRSLAERQRTIMKVDLKIELPRTPHVKRITSQQDAEDLVEGVHTRDEIESGAINL